MPRAGARGGGGCAGLRRVGAGGLCWAQEGGVCGGGWGVSRTLSSTLRQIPVGRAESS